MKKDCNECVYCEPNEINDRFNKCTNPKAKYEYCEIERQDGWFWTLILGGCGSMARHFKFKGEKQIIINQTDAD